MSDVKSYKINRYPEFLQKANAARQLPVADMAASYVRLKAYYEEVEEEAKRMKAALDVLKQSILPEALADEGVKTITVHPYRKPGADGPAFRVTASEKLYASAGETPSLMYEWLQESANGALIKQTVNASSLSALVKEMIVTEGKEPPDGTVNIYFQANTSVTKVK